MYIRTKDGIVKVETIADIQTKVIFKDNFVAQSENLEELCDEFVGVDKTCENGHQLLRAIPYKCANYWNGGVYGAVWCEFGLKYVAKLNSKGELELI